MHGRWFRILLLAFQVVWLGAIVPGHTRGAQTLPGTKLGKAAAAEGHACCAVRAEHRATPADGGPAAPADEQGGSTGERMAHCAVCHLVARLMLPPVVDLAPPPLELLDVLPADRAVRPTLPSPALAYLARGPPAAV